MPPTGDDPYAADGYICCAEGAIPLAVVRAQLATQAEAFARVAGMREPAVYARWLLAQYGMMAEANVSQDGQDAQVMSYAQERRQATV